jgi:hypothetical protein
MMLAIFPCRTTYNDCASFSPLCKIYLLDAIRYIPDEPFMCLSLLKKTKGAPEARKKASEVMKVFFSDPENRHKRSLSMKGNFPSLPPIP